MHFYIVKLLTIVRDDESMFRPDIPAGVSWQGIDLREDDKLPGGFMVVKVMASFHASGYEYTPNRFYLGESESWDVLVVPAVSFIPEVWRGKLMADLISAALEYRRPKPNPGEGGPPPRPLEVSE